MNKKIEVVLKFIAKNSAPFLVGIFLLAAFFVFNLSGVQNDKEDKTAQTEEQVSDNSLEIVEDSVEEFAENIEDITTPIEAQAEELPNAKNTTLADDIADENIPPEEKSPAVVKSKWAWPLVNLPKPKIKTRDNELRIGFITDTHITSIQYANGVIQLGDELRKRMEYFIKQMNNGFAPNFILINGDVIEGTKRPSEIGMEELSQCRDVFNQTSIKKYWTVGNHDLRSVTKNQWKEALGIDYTSKSFEVGDYKIIIVDGNFYYSDGSDIRPGKSFTPGILSIAQKEWLKAELESSQKKKIVFIHQPLYSARTPLRGASEIRGMLSQNNVVAVFSGHTEELLSTDMDGVKYVTIPGMTKNSAYLGNFAEIRITESDLSTKIYYKSSEGGTYKTRL